MRHPDQIVAAVALSWGACIVIAAGAAFIDCVAKASPPPVIRAVPTRAVVEVREHHEEGDGGLCPVPETPGLDYREMLLAEPPTPDEVTLIATAIGQCKRQAWRVADPVAMLALLRHEVEMGVPDEARGITLATWCIEGALRAKASTGGPLRGDPRGGVAMAWGPFQLWPWQRAWCGLDEHEADDLLVAASCYWRRVSERRSVRALDCAESWRVGEALAANGPRYLPMGCAAESGHWRELRRWSR